MQVYVVWGLVPFNAATKSLETELPSGSTLCAVSVTGVTVVVCEAKQNPGSLNAYAVLLIEVFVTTPSVVVTSVLYVVVRCLTRTWPAAQTPAWLAPPETPFTVANVLVALPLSTCCSTIVVGVRVTITFGATQLPTLDKAYATPLIVGEPAAPPVVTTVEL